MGQDKIVVIQQLLFIVVQLFLLVLFYSDQGCNAQAWWLTLALGPLHGSQTRTHWRRDNLSVERWGDYTVSRNRRREIGVRLVSTRVWQERHTVHRDRWGWYEWGVDCGVGGVFQTLSYGMVSRWRMSGSTKAMTQSSGQSLQLRVVPNCSLPGQYPLFPVTFESVLESWYSVKGRCWNRCRRRRSYRRERRGCRWAKFHRRTAEGGKEATQGYCAWSNIFKVIHDFEIEKYLMRRIPLKTIPGCDHAVITVLANRFLPFLIHTQ